MSVKKIGIFGGTFSPPHVGHVASAEAFAASVNFDKILIIPDYLPPHKELDGGADEKQRLEMCSLAFSHIENVEISNIEILRGGRSYTYQTLEALSAPETELYFLMGTDMFLTLPEWKHPERIFDLATICLVRRENDMAEEITEKVREYTELYNAKIINIKSETVTVSSSELRALLHRGEYSDYIPKAVMDYIKEAGIYQ